ncbi:DUF397 domain-containing protein [Actinoallomurus sp. NPDC052274]|uniref:DUF397 domain-containing protein n=1 Tax=Actinoallomurus sp. NPDC052274 TaxID=3155420 RepID=UPI0034212EBA
MSCQGRPSVQWHKSSYSDGTGGECVEVVVRRSDSRDPRDRWRLLLLGRSKRQ